jgi:hypothetical protein
MAILERRIQKVVVKEAEYRAWEQEWEVIEKRLGGFPPKRHYGLISGSDDFGTMVWERDWESFAAMDAAYTKLFDDSEGASLADSASATVSGERIEYYWAW